MDAHDTTKTHDDDDDRAPAGAPHRVHFFPPLHEQRRAWILDAVRRARPRVVSVLDVGCGEGELLGALCQPAECLAVADDFDARHGVPPGDAAWLRSVVDTVESVHPRAIAGLDAGSAPLALAKALLEGSSGGCPFLPPAPRWQGLTVQLWGGGLEEYNAALAGYDCIVSSEVYVRFLPA